DGRLWLSDMHDHKVIAVDETGVAESIVEVPAWPSGLGWMPDGSLLIVAMRERKLLRWVDGELEEHADLSALASFHCNDMVVDAHGRAYVGHFGFDLHNQADFKAAELIAVEPDGSARIAARDMAFPNGAVIAPDGKTLIAGETFAGRLTALDIDSEGDLSNRRVWAQLPQGVVPDGICLDVDMGIWVASPTSNEVLRALEGGEITDRISLDQGAFACMLGGADRRRLFVLTAADSDPETCRAKRSARIEYVDVEIPGGGLP
ncbi:MAG: SMP-30/gluconolactonase/LRE family protein, partial [Hyphomicrobium sp.]